MPTIADATGLTSGLLALNPLDPASIATAGIFLIVVAIFAETGLLVGIFLPGDSLLFTAGFFASTGELPLWGVLLGTAAAAVAGAQTGHAIGRWAGPALFNRPDSRLFKRDYVDRTAEYLERYGPPKFLILARFIPIVRTLAFPLSGVVGISARRFFVWNVVGGLLWSLGVTLTGWGLGQAVGADAKDFPIDKIILPLVAGIVVISVIPMLLEWRRHRRAAAQSGASRPAPAVRVDGERDEQVPLG